MNREERIGRGILIFFIALVLLASAVAIGVYAVFLGLHRLPVQIIRFLLTAGLCYWVYRGSYIGRAILIVLLIPGGVLALMILWSFVLLGPIVSGIVAMAFAAAFYFSFIFVLLFSRHVIAFLRYQRDEPLIELRRTMDAREAGLTRAELQEVSGHISDIAQGELPLGPGLLALAEEMPPGRIRDGLIVMVRQLETGDDLETALESQGAPADLRALVRAGMRSGQVGEVLAQYVTHARNVGILRRRAILGLAYPAVLLVVAVALCSFIITFIVPKFKKIFEDFGTELPGITLLLVNISDLLVYGGIWILIFGIPLLIGAWFLMKWLLGDVLYRRLVCHIPFVGPMLRFCALSRFSNLFALLIENEVPMPEALRVAGEGVDDAEIQEACRNLALDVESGQPLAQAAHALTGFPATFVHALTREEHRQALPETMHALADMFEGRARIQTSFVGTIFEPLLIVFLGCTIGLIVIALFMPLIKLLNDLS